MATEVLKLLHHLWRGISRNRVSVQRLLSPIDPLTGSVVLHAIVIQQDIDVLGKAIQVEVLGVLRIPRLEIFKYAFEDEAVFGTMDQNRYEGRIAIVVEEFPYILLSLLLLCID